MTALVASRTSTLVTVRVAVGQHLVGRFAIDRTFVLGSERACLDGGGALGLRRRADAAARRCNEAALDRLGHALGVEKGDQRLADAELGDGGLGVEFLVR